MDPAGYEGLLMLARLPAAPAAAKAWGRLPGMGSFCPHRTCGGGDVVAGRPTLARVDLALGYRRLQL
jgi:hypothetical protein